MNKKTKSFPSNNFLGTAALVSTIALASQTMAVPSSKAWMGTTGLLARRAPDAVPASPGNDAFSGISIRRLRLDNGLRVVLNRDVSVPTVAVAVYYDVGSRNEVQGRTGFAHLFEHMMFQGSANVGKSEHMRIVESRGGDFNGTTSEDRTNYFETLPSNELELGMWLEADRMRSLAVTEENFENQRAVVMDERRQSYENQPYALSFLRINEMAFQGFFPYEHSTIGEMADLEAAPLSAVQEFFHQYYTPSNAVLVVSGDFEEEEALALAQRHFGSIESHEVPAFNPPEFVAPASSSATMTDAHAQLPAFHIAYPIPPNRHDDHYALEMLTLILADGDSSRFEQSLVREREILSAIHVGTDDRRGPDLLSMFAIVSTGHTIEEGRRAIDAEIESVKRRGVTARELQKAQNRVQAHLTFALQSNLGRAQQLGEFELYYGDAEIIRTELSRYLAVTRADIQRVAQTYLVNDHRALLDVVPAPAAAEEGAAQ